MSQSFCDKCGGQSTGYVCTDCCRVMSDDLRRIHWLLSELEVTYVRLAKVGAENVGGRSADTPLPWNEKASSAARLTHNCISTWSGALQYVADEPLDDDSTTAAILWMRRNIRAFPRLERAAQAATALATVAQECLKAIDHPEIKTSFDIGHCPEGCAGLVRAFVPADPDASGWLRCSGCAMRWETTEWHEVCQRIKVAA